MGHDLSHLAEEPGTSLEFGNGKEGFLGIVHRSRPARRLRPAALVGASGNDPNRCRELVGGVPK